MNIPALTPRELNILNNALAEFKCKYPDGSSARNEMDSISVKVMRALEDAEDNVVSPDTPSSDAQFLSNIALKAAGFRPR